MWQPNYYPLFLLKIFWISAYLSITAAPAQPLDAPANPATQAAVTIPLSPLILAGDRQRGRNAYFQCRACHSLKHNKEGPKHCGVLGRAAGSLTDFQYSPAMQNANFVWNPEILNEFLKNPKDIVPNTKMGYVGSYDEQERADIIAFLYYVAQSPLCHESQTGQ